MTFLSTTVRATHLLTNAAWFGGSLMGATGLGAAAAVGDDADLDAFLGEQQRGAAGLIDRPLASLRGRR